jgi:hypothetical protein
MFSLAARRSGTFPGPTTPQQVGRISSGLVTFLRQEALRGAVTPRRAAVAPPGSMRYRLQRQHFRHRFNERAPHPRPRTAHVSDFRGEPGDFRPAKTPGPPGLPGRCHPTRTASATRSWRSSGPSFPRLAAEPSLVRAGLLAPRDRLLIADFADLAGSTGSVRCGRAGLDDAVAGRAVRAAGRVGQGARRERTASTDLASGR